MPVIVISAYEKQDEITKTIEIGANDFVCKPIDKALLSSKLTNFLDTELVRKNILPVFKVKPPESDECSFILECNIEKIDDFRIQFETSHHIQIGTIFPFMDSIILKILNDTEQVDLKVCENWSDDDGSKHFYAEFCELQLSQMQLIRKYIVNK